MRAVRPNKFLSSKVFTLCRRGAVFSPSLPRTVSFLVAVEVLATHNILAGRKGQPIILDNVSKRNIRPTLKEAGVTWHGFYSIRRFHATQVRMESKSSETAAKALGNTKDVCDKHYIKPETVLSDVRKAVNDALSGLIH